MNDVSKMNPGADNAFAAVPVPLLPDVLPALSGGDVSHRTSDASGLGNVSGVNPAAENEGTTCANGKAPLPRIPGLCSGPGNLGTSCVGNCAPPMLLLGMSQLNQALSPPRLQLSQLTPPSTSLLPTQNNLSLNIQTPPPSAELLPGQARQMNANGSSVVNNNGSSVTLWAPYETPWVPQNHAASPSVVVNVNINVRYEEQDGSGMLMAFPEFPHSNNGAASFSRHTMLSHQRRGQAATFSNFNDARNYNGQSRIRGGHSQRMRAVSYPAGQQYGSMRNREHGMANYEYTIAEIKVGYDAAEGVEVVPPAGVNGLDAPELHDTSLRDLTPLGFANPKGEEALRLSRPFEEKDPTLLHELARLPINETTSMAAVVAVTNQCKLDQPEPQPHLNQCELLFLVERMTASDQQGHDESDATASTEASSAVEVETAVGGRDATDSTEASFGASEEAAASGDNSEREKDAGDGTGVVEQQDEGVSRTGDGTGVVEQQDEGVSRTGDETGVVEQQDEGVSRILSRTKSCPGRLYKYRENEKERNELRARCVSNGYDDFFGDSAFYIPPTDEDEVPDRQDQQNCSSSVAACPNVVDNGLHLASPAEENISTGQLTHPITGPLYALGLVPRARSSEEGGHQYGHKFSEIQIQEKRYLVVRSQPVLLSADQFWNGVVIKVIEDTECERSPGLRLRPNGFLLFRKPLPHGLFEANERSGGTTRDMFLNQVALEARRSSDFFNNLIQAWERKHVCGAPVYREVHFRSWEKRERAKQVLHHRACRPLEILGYWKKPYFWRGAFVAVFVEDGRYCKMLRIGEMPRIDGKGATRRESSWRLSHCSQYPQRGLYVLGLEKSSSHPTKLTPKREKSVQA